MARQYDTRFYRRRKGIVYLDVAIPVTTETLQREFDRLAADANWTESKRNNRWSYLRRAVENAVMKGACRAADLRPVFDILDKFAPPPDGASSVRKTLAFLLGRPATRRDRGYTLDEHRWAPLIAVTPQRGGGRKHYALLETLLRAMGAWDEAPARMPGVKELLHAAPGLAFPSTLRGAVATYRKARACLLECDPSAAARIAPIAKTHHRSLGLETLPRDILVPVLRDAGCTTLPSDMSPMDLLEVVAPVLHSELMEWKRDPRRGERPGHVTLVGEYHTERCLIRLAAGLLLAGRSQELRNLSLLGLWHPTEPPLEPVGDSPVLARVRKYTGMDAAVLHPPIRVALDAVAPGSRAIASVQDGQGKYTHSTISALQRLWTLTAGLYRLPLLEANPGAWRDLEQRYNAELAHFSGHAATPHATRDKGRVLELVSLPQLVCLGFPLLERRRQQARTQWLDAARKATAAGHVPDAVPAVRTAFEEYADAAELRLLPGIYAADGLRLNNYRYGILGSNYLITFTRDSHGRANGIHEVTTRWTGSDRVRARTKRGLEPRRGARGRPPKVSSRQMPPWPAAYVPLDALWEYLTEVTLTRAIQAGALPAGASVEDMVAAQCIPMVLSPRCKQGRLIHPAGTRLGVGRVGKALWWTARHALGRELPDWDKLSRRDEYYRILVGHDIRLLTSCYWGKVMQDWEYAAFLTNDKKSTLEDFYSAEAYARWSEAGGDVSHWDHPRAFATEMQKIRDDRFYIPVFQSYQASVPPDAMNAMAAVRTASPGTPQRRIRRARPGQRPPTRP